MTSLSCLLHLDCRNWPAPVRSNTIGNNEAVPKAVQDLALGRHMLIKAASRVDGSDSNVWTSSREPAFDKTSFETLVLEGHPIANAIWYPEDYFDRLMALKHLIIQNGFHMQSGNTKVSNDFFSHIPPLHSLPWQGL